MTGFARSAAAPPPSRSLCTGVRARKLWQALVCAVIIYAGGSLTRANAQTQTPPPSQPAPAPAPAPEPGKSPMRMAIPSTETVPPDKVPEFAVASIKPDKSGSGGVRIMFGPDGFTAENIPLKLLIREAFDVNDDQISGLPDWTGSAMFDIDAKVDTADLGVMDKLTFDQRKQMMVKLLTDRFGLKTHQETKDLPVYALVVAKGGSKLHEAKPDSTYPNGLKGPDGQAGGPGMMMFNGQGQLTGQGVPISDLTRILGQQTQRTVIDKTGLTGIYDFTLQMPPPRGPGAMPKPASDGASAAGDDAQDTGPSIFTTVEDQLGLKLESQKAPLPVIVIDHIQQPSAN